jgi:tRNA (adenine57-N1/adenine58-N1)-methyltransferase
MPWGSQVFSHKGSPFFLFQPALGNLLQNIPRNTQILYPKDIGFILVTMGIGPGQHIIEAGTGSGGLLTALAYTVGSEGHIYTYEVNPEIQKLAQKNLHRLGLGDRITYYLRDIEDGFEESNIDALFLDVQNPHDYISQVHKALKRGGFFGSLVPTTNQISRLLTALKKDEFAFIEVCETFLRYYKPEPERLRPTDRMVAHTGYLVFARSVIINDHHPDEDAIRN